jgi:hypothetical protein
MHRDTFPFIAAVVNHNAHCVSNYGTIETRTNAELLGDIGGAPLVHNHDGDVLQHDGVNSNGGAFAFNTTGAVTFNQNVDLNGNDLILDVDGDSYLHASADDIIDLILATATGEFAININGAEDFIFTANTLTLTDGSNLVLQEDINFIGASTENIVHFPDNLPVALDFSEAANMYQRFITTNGAEAVHFGVDVGIGQAPDVGLSLHVYNAADCNVEIESNADEAWLIINSNTDGLGTEISGIAFDDNSNIFWYTYKDTDNHYKIYDITRTAVVFEIEDNGDMILMENGGFCGIGVNPTNAELHVYRNATIGTWGSLTVNNACIWMATQL